MIEYFQHVSDLADAGCVYVYNFLLDYQRYMELCGGYVPVLDFLKNWTCIPPEKFTYLKKGDIFYYGPEEMVCIDDAFQQDDGTWLVEAERHTMVKTGQGMFITEGDAYCKHSPWIYPPENYKELMNSEREKDRRRKEKVCRKAILITRINQQSS